ncbi:MAG: formimidoylglutamase [Bdellovibrionaceae bacterium]|nr:formimidoylglutamase [Pseudobdellovibrionaceae bacterium]
MNFQPVSTDLFFSRHDPQDPRLGEFAQPTGALTQAKAGTRAIAVLGYPDDEGIRLNGGRPGAAEAPDRIRRPLYKMTPSALSIAKDVQIADLGNLDAAALSLGERHQAAQRRAQEAYARGYRVLSFGGGHDYGFPDTAAFLQALRDANELAETKTRPLVLNFDAHLDVRPLDRGLTSGTPFFRMLEAYPDVDFAEIGIQAHCNAKSHRDWAESRGTQILSLEDSQASGLDLVTYVTRRLETWLVRPRPTFLSIDIDGFSSAFAPGCSQSWASGFAPDEFLRLLQVLTARLDVRGMGIYEVSPALDTDDRTAKLAALLAHRFIFPL